MFILADYFRNLDVVSDSHVRMCVFKDHEAKKGAKSELVSNSAVATFNVCNMVCMLKFVFCSGLAEVERECIRQIGCRIRFCTLLQKCTPLQCGPIHKTPLFLRERSHRRRSGSLLKLAGRKLIFLIVFLQRSSDFGWTFFTDGP